MRLFRLPFVLMVAAFLALPALARVMDEPGMLEAPADNRFLAGKLLVAAPEMKDSRFAKSVIYMVEHDRGGAFGLIVNKTLGRGPMRSLLEGFGVEAEKSDMAITLHFGGPVEMEKGFVLHTMDYDSDKTKRLPEGLGITSDVEILTRMAKGEGPKRAIFCLGYAGWGPGQLESELDRDDWLSAEADQDLIFHKDLDAIWPKALDVAGISL